jgi:uncharacterized protein
MYLQENKIGIIREYFANQPILRAFLFGSFVRGEATENSDVDLLVELDYDQMKGGLHFIKMQLDLQHLLHQKVDLVSINGLSKYIQPYILEEKQEIYAR